MANGYNKKFLRDPIGFLSENCYYDSYFSGDNSPGNGDYYMDFVMESGGYLNLKNYSGREHHCGAVPVHAYYLCAKVNDVSEMPVGNTANYLFTPMLSGCTFAVYGNDRKNISAVHINDRAGSGYIAGRIHNILAGNHAFCKILCKTEDAAGIEDPNVFTYDHNSNRAKEILVFGMIDTDGDWHFYRKPFKGTDELVEM